MVKRVFFWNRFISTLLTSLTAVILMSSTIHAALTYSGDVTLGILDSIIGDSGSGELSITDGYTLNSYYGYIGYQIGSDGTVIVDGEGSKLNTSQDFSIGYKGTGELRITNGGAVTNSYGTIGSFSDSIGTVSVDGEGSTWSTSSHISAGCDGKGILNISNSGLVLSSTLYIGWQTGSDGTVTVHGAGSILNLSELLSVGNDGTGTLGITNSGSVLSETGYIGSGPGAGSTGTANVNGMGSTWSITEELNVGLGETGRLNITNGGVVTCSSGTVGIGSTGTVAVDGEGSNWDISNDLAIYMGELSVTDGGIVSSFDGIIGYGDIDSAGTISVDGEGSTWDISNELLIRSAGDGTLSITGSGTVTSFNAYIGGYFNGTVNVDGEGSTWTNENELYVGLMDGTGKLSITDGGSVTSSSSIIGYGFVFEDDGTYIDVGTVFGANGTAIVHGEGASWTVNSGLYVGDEDDYGTGKLSIGNGGLVSADYISVNRNATLNIDIGTESILKIDIGPFTNEGTILLAAPAGVTSGTYTPIDYDDIIEGQGVVQALGGVWNAIDHTFIVNEIITAQGDGGASAALDLAVNQRVLVTDSITGKSAGVAFITTNDSALSHKNLSAVQKTEDAATISLTITTVGGDDLDSLQTLLSDRGEDILSAWSFSTEGYTVSSNTPVYLSLDAGSSNDLSALTIWHLADGEWTEYAAPDLAFDGVYASFSAHGFSGFAVTGAVQSVEYCSGDADKDGDVDGLDLFSLVSAENGISIEDFSQVFGRNDCPSAAGN